MIAIDIKLVTKDKGTLTKEAQRESLRGRL